MPGEQSGVNATPNKEGLITRPGQRKVKNQRNSRGGNIVAGNR